MLVMPSAFTLVSCLAFSSNLKMEENVHPKRRLTFNGLHGVIFTPLRTSNPRFTRVYNTGTNSYVNVLSVCHF
jgi:hypothetical protein